MYSLLLQSSLLLNVSNERKPRALDTVKGISLDRVLDALQKGASCLYLTLPSPAKQGMPWIPEM